MSENPALADVAQRDRALDPTISVIVQAPAGSGKTELLIQRYLVLLARVDEPESVLAMTFTRKAAGEMRRRVLEAFERAEGPEPEKEHERKTWRLARAAHARDGARGWRIAENPSRLRMRTIDSLCASLVRQMPWLARFGAPADIVDDATELFSAAARNTLSMLETGPCTAELEILLGHLDNDVSTLERLLAGMLGKRDQWLRHIGVGGDRIAQRASLESALHDVVEEALIAVREAVPPMLSQDIVASAAFAARNLAGEQGNAIAACAGLGDVPDSDLESLPVWLGLAKLLLTNDGGWRKRIDKNVGFPPTEKARKQAFKELLDSLSPADDFLERLDELRKLPPAAFTDSQWEVVDALFTLLPVAVAQLQVVFRERGETDHTEVSLAALRALGDEGHPTDLALALDYRIEHLLVDEFQDTSFSQFELIRRLTAGWAKEDGRTLFVVGDPMQSIYRFREAEVGLFLKAWREGIGTVRLEPLRLSVNFRSGQTIVEWVNQVFPKVLAPIDDVFTGAVRFSASMAANPAGPNPAVEVHPFIGPSGAAEAQAVLEVVRRTRARDKQAVIAILVRARTHLPSILAALRSDGIKYRAVDIDQLGEVQIIRDLLALTRALLHPGDRISWLAVLRAPWCGLSLADLHALLSDPEEWSVKAQPLAVVDLMQDEIRVERLSEDGRTRLRRVRQVLSASLADRRHLLRGWVEGAWLALGGPACAGGGDLENAAAYFELLDGLDEGRDVDFDILSESVARLFASPDPAADDTLQVMSIHKAKGLQFDVVLLPGLGRKPRSDESRLLMWMERQSKLAGSGLLMAPIKQTGSDDDPVYGYLRHVNGQKSRHETGRMLYVAATRAKQQLHLLGHTGWDDKKGELKPPAAGSLLDRLWPSVLSEFAIKAQDYVPPAAEAVAARGANGIKRLHSDWSLPDPPAAFMPPAADPVREDQPISFDWVGDVLRHVGTVTHRVLLQIAREDLDRWDGKRVEDARPLYRAALADLGVSPADMEQAASKVEQAIRLTLRHGKGRWILDKRHDEACSEYALTGLLDGEIVSVRIDRTFVDEKAVRWIVDFKTSSHEGGSIEEFLTHEVQRYRAQLLKYRRLVALRERRPVRLALFFPLLGQWREIEEAELAEPLTRQLNT